MHLIHYPVHRGVLPLVTAVSLLIHAPLHAEKIYWLPDSDGSWANAANWTSDPGLPGITDEAFIDVGGPGSTRTVTLDNHSANIENLFSRENLKLDNRASLWVQNHAEIEQALDISGVSEFRSYGDVTTTGAVSVDVGIVSVQNGGSFVAQGPISLNQAEIHAQDNASIEFHNVSSMLFGNNVNIYPDIKAETGASILYSGLSTLQFLEGDSAEIQARSGGNIVFNGVNKLEVVEDQIANNRLQAVDLGSRIDLSQVTQITAPNASNTARVDLALTAGNGGVVELSALQSSDHADFYAYGVGSKINANSMTSFTDGQLRVADGGIIGVGALNTIDGSSVHASNGGSINLDKIVSYQVNPNVIGDTRNSFIADGSGSQIMLDNLLTVSGTLNSTPDFDIDALNGGSVSLSSLSNFSNETLAAKAEGLGSLVSLNALTELQGTDRTIHYVGAADGGTTDVTALTSASWTQVWARGAGSKVNHALQSLSNGTLSVSEGATINTNQLSNIDGSNLYARDGSTLSLAQVSSYNSDRGVAFSETAFEAEGAGSVLDVSTITLATGGLSSSFGSRNWGISAIDGGQVLLNNLPSINEGGTDVLADGANSLVELSAIRQIDGHNGSSNSSLEAINGGEIRLSSSAAADISMNRVDITLNNDGSILNTARITTFDNGRIESNGLTRSFNFASNEGVDFIAKQGAVVTWNTASSDYNISGTLSRDSYLQASDAGTVLRLNNIASLETRGWDQVFINALDGGQVELQGVQSISDTAGINMRADGSSSLLTLNALQDWTADETYNGQMTASQGGRIQLNDAARTRLTNVVVTIDESSQISGHEVELLGRRFHPSSEQIRDRATLQGNGSYDFHVLNTSGLVSAGLSQGDLTIGGNYSEGIDALMEFELFSASSFDSVDILGNALFAGTLDILLDPNFQIVDGMVFDIISIAGMRSGFFQGADQGALLMQSGEVGLYIDYFGGDGNDVSLYTAMVSNTPSTPAPLAPTLLLMLIGAGLLTRQQSHASIAPRH